MTRELEGSVVVITGASSGLGAASARAFASHHTSVVLAARTEAALTAVGAECELAGARSVLVVPTDVSDAASVQRLADAAVAEFGRIDTWVNTAAVLVAGVLGDEPPDELERLIATNVTGTLFVSRAALVVFREQQHGVLIDTSSLLGIVPNPLVPAYVMSKFAVRGLGLSLQQLTRAWPDIEVCTVMPGPIDTPLFERAANHTGRALRAIPPAYSTERVAATVVACARRPRHEVTTGVLGHAILLGHRIAPRVVETIVAVAAANLLVRADAADHTAGALFDAVSEGNSTGGWRRWDLRRALGDAVGRLCWRLS